MVKLHAAPGADNLRLASLVPSLTDTLYALGFAPLAVTDYCLPPAGSAPARVGGPKTPRLEQIAELGCNLVLVNDEENRREDMERLEAMGVACYAFAPRTERQVVTSLRRLAAALDCVGEGERIVTEIETQLSHVEADSAMREPLRVFCPVWRDPWISCSGATFTGSMLRLFSLENICEDAAEHFPRLTLEQARERKPQLIVLPDEPYRFTQSEADELAHYFDAPAIVVDGRHLHWMGAHMREGLPALAKALAEIPCNMCG